MELSIRSTVPGINQFEKEKLSSFTAWNGICCTRQKLSKILGSTIRHFVINKN